MTVGSAIANGLASSLTEAGPRDSRSTMARRLLSPSAWNTWSSPTYLGTYLSISGSGSAVKFAAVPPPTYGALAACSRMKPDDALRAAAGVGHPRTVPIGFYCGGMTVLARPARASRAAAVGRGAGERDQLGRIPRDLWEALAADKDAGRGTTARCTGAARGNAHPSPAPCPRAGAGGSGRAPGGRWRTGRGAWSSRRTCPATCSSRGVPAPEPVTGCLPVIRQACGDEAQLPGGVASGRRVARGQLPRLPGPAGGPVLAPERSAWPTRPGGGNPGRVEILAALAQDASLGEIEAAIEAASAAGITGAQQVLF